MSAWISSPDAGSVPTVRGRRSSSSAWSEGDGLGRHRPEQRRRPGTLAALDRLPELDVGTEAARAHEHGEPAVGSVPSVRSPDGASRSSSARSTRELVGREVLGDRRPVLAALEVRPVAAHAHDDGLALGVGPDGDRVDLAGVDLPEVRGHVLLEAAMAPAGRIPAGPGTGADSRRARWRRPRRSRSASARAAPPAAPSAISSRSSSMAAVKP